MSNKSEELGMSIGRPCCGGRTMNISADGEWTKSKFLESREFKGWTCSVNWFFLHIEQQTDSVFHHQTCKAKFDGTRGPISSLSDFDSYIEQLEKQLLAHELPSIVCTKQTCGCGLCAPKSANESEYKNLVSSHIDIAFLK